MFTQLRGYGTVNQNHSLFCLPHISYTVLSSNIRCCEPVNRLQSSPSCRVVGIQIRMLQYYDPEFHRFPRTNEFCRTASDHGEPRMDICCNAVSRAECRTLDTLNLILCALLTMFSLPLLTLFVHLSAMNINSYVQSNISCQEPTKREIKSLVSPPPRDKNQLTVTPAGLSVSFRDQQTSFCKKPEPKYLNFVSHLAGIRIPQLHLGRRKLL